MILKNLFFLICFLNVSLLLASPYGFGDDVVQVDKYGYKIKGEYKYLRGGTLQWFRLPEAQWEDRIKRFKAAGFNTIDLYVPWSVIEPSPGEFNFKTPDLLKFLDLVKKHELYLYFRPGPYITNEMDAGGLPPWMLKNTTKKSRKDDGLVFLRDNDPDFLRYVERYFDKLNEVIHPYLASQGGPIILYALENEYDYFHDMTKLDKVFMVDGLPERSLFYSPDTSGYFSALRDMALADGIDVPLTTCPGKNIRNTGNVPGIIPMPNLYIKKKVEWNVFKDLTSLHNPKRFNGVYVDVPSGITEADRYPALMKRIFMAGMDAYFAFNISGSYQEGYRNAIGLWNFNFLKLLDFNDYSSFMEVGYFHNVIDFHGMISASGGLREKYYGYRRGNLFIDSFESKMAPLLHSRRSGSVRSSSEVTSDTRNEVLDKRVSIDHPEVGAMESGKRRHYWLDSGDGTYFISLLNETRRTLEIKENSIDVEGFKFPQFSVLTLPTEVIDPHNVYRKIDPDELTSTSILVYNHQISDSLNLHYTTSDILTLRDFNDEKLLVVYGKKWTEGEIRLRFSGSKYQVMDKTPCVKIMEDDNSVLTFTYTHDTHNYIFLRNEKGEEFKILILNRHDAGRAWFLKKNKHDVLIVGPDYLEESSLARIPETEFFMEFSDSYKKRKVLVLSKEPFDMPGLNKVKTFHYGSGLSEFEHSRDFNFPTFKGDLSYGYIKEDMDETKPDFVEDRGISFVGDPRPLEKLDIFTGHAWYRSKFFLNEASNIEAASIKVEHASDFVGIYVNGNYVSTLAPLGTELNSENENPRYRFKDFAQFLKRGENVISFRTEIWGHGSFMFPRGQLLSGFAQLPAIAFDSNKGLYGKAKVVVKYAGSMRLKDIPLKKWWVGSGLTGERQKYYGADRDISSWEKRSLPIKLKPGEVFWYRTKISKDDFPNISEFHAPMVLALKGRSVKATIYLNGVLIGRWLSDGDWIRRGSWVRVVRDLWASTNPDHFPISVEALSQEGNTLAIAFEDASTGTGGRIDVIDFLYNQERWGDTKSWDSEYHTLRSIKLPVKIFRQEK